MTAAPFCDRIRRTANRLLRAEHGNVAVMFAFALVPILGLVGAAIDYTRANSARTAMQAALDATALMVSKEAAGLDASQVEAKAQSYFKALYNHPEAPVPPIDVKFTPNSGKGATVVVSGSASMKTDFLKVVGIPKIDFGTSATTTWGSARLRVALVLDTTGSMDQAGKMTALKSATKDLLSQLQKSANSPEDVYVSIIPFSKNVNLGPANYNATWIDWTDWLAEPAVLKSSKPSNWYQTGPGSSCPLTNNNHGVVCATSAGGSTTTTTVPNSGNFKNLICPSVDTGKKNSTKIGIIYNGCYNSWTQCVGAGCACTTTDTSICSCTGSGASKTCKVNKSGYYEHTWRPGTSETYTPALVLSNGDPYATPPTSTWNGCITDRGTTTAPSNDYDRLVTAPNLAVPASKFPAEQNSYCSPAISGLSNDWTGIGKQVDALYPKGATNQPIGLVWGWQSLVGGGPLTMPPKDPNYTYIDAIVLMSDGLNTLNRWYGDGSSTNTSVDNRMYANATTGTCVNVKNAGIMIYAIHVNTDKDPMSTLLQRCATSSDRFWMVTTGTELGAVFNQIGIELSQLRLAR
ncbi:MAG TPA: TadE/TadG family type IV pilus assembly protein [Xanthobacteraceae bacterium]|nr:TadE/TadG family type IV pilus assembly protein [Xanthobacteraceae bacterium]